MTNTHGNVVVEFVGVVVGLMLPLVYVGSACWDVARVQLALRTAAHSGSRAYVLSPNARVATSRLGTVVSTALQDAGVSATGTIRRVSCSQTPCLTPGGYVTVSLTRPVAVAVPVLGTWTVRMTASDTSVVDVWR